MPLSHVWQLVIFLGEGQNPLPPSRSAHAPYKLTAVLASTFCQVVGWTYFYLHGDFLLRYIHVLAVIFFGCKLDLVIGVF